MTVKNNLFDDVISSSDSDQPAEESNEQFPAMVHEEGDEICRISCICMYPCTECRCLDSSSLIKESFQKEAIRSMAVEVLMTNTSLVNFNTITLLHAW